MAQFVLNVDDNDLPRVTAALSATGGFEEATPENAQATVHQWIQDTVVAFEYRKAQQVALAAVVPGTPPAMYWPDQTPVTP